MSTDRDSLISARQNREMFDTISARYDVLNGLLSLGLDRVWRRRTVRLLEPCDGEMYLDVGSGTADLGLDILAAARSAIVVGLDPAERMLALGRSKLASAGLENGGAAVAGDALRLPFPAETFHGVVSAFCLRNVEDRQQCFAEMNRVLRNGGRAVVAELSTPRNPLLRFLHRIYNRVWVPFLGGLLSRGGAYGYLVKSIRAFPQAEAVVAGMRSAGFSDAYAVPLHGGITTVFIGRK